MAVIHGRYGDSLGGFYSMISLKQGGPDDPQRRGRCMGSAAWGDGDRRTNRYYTSAHNA
jgi:carbamoyltransferase